MAALQPLEVVDNGVVVRRGELRGNRVAVAGPGCLHGAEPRGCPEGDTGKLFACLSGGKVGDSECGKCPLRDSLGCVVNVLVEARETVLQLVGHSCVDGEGMLDIEDAGIDVGEVAADVGWRNEGAGVVVEVVDGADRSYGGDSLPGAEIVVDAVVDDPVIEAGGIAAEIVIRDGGGVSGCRQEGLHLLSDGREVARGNDIVGWKAILHSHEGLTGAVCRSTWSWWGRKGMPDCWILFR